MGKVLVVEDNQANMALAVFLLQSAGHTVLSATDAESGVTLARDEQPKEDDADYERNNLTPVKDNPAYVEEDRQGDETYPQHCEGHYSFGAARDAHDLVVYAKADSVAPLMKHGRRFVAALIPVSNPLGHVSVAARNCRWSRRS